MEVHALREPCLCGGTGGRIETKNGQDCVYCLTCDRWCYNAPRVETGREVRSAATLHNGVKTSVRQRVLERARGRCELCGNTHDLHVSHLLSVKDGLERGLTEVELNAVDNLAAFCRECNLGQSARSLNPALFLAIATRWLESNGAS